MMRRIDVLADTLERELRGCTELKFGKHIVVWLAGTGWLVLDREQIQRGGDLVGSRLSLTEALALARKAVAGKSDRIRIPQDPKTRK
jgi:hypothetical protein